MLPHLASSTRIALLGGMTSLTSRGDSVILCAVRRRPVLIMLRYPVPHLVCLNNVLISATQQAYHWQTFYQSYLWTGQTIVNSVEAATRNLVLS
jgi:hypothetical protein